MKFLSLDRHIYCTRSIPETTTNSYTCVRRTCIKYIIRSDVKAPRDRCSLNARYNRRRGLQATSLRKGGHIPAASTEYTAECTFSLEDRQSTIRNLLVWHKWPKTSKRAMPYRCVGQDILGNLHRFPDQPPFGPRRSYVIMLRRQAMAIMRALPFRNICVQDSCLTVHVKRYRGMVKLVGEPHSNVFPQPDQYKGLATGCEPINVVYKSGTVDKCSWVSPARQSSTSPAAAVPRSFSRAAWSLQGGPTAKPASKSMTAASTVIF